MKYAGAISRPNPTGSSRTIIRGRRCRRGVALVWSAIVLGVMILMLGLSVDWGKAAWNVHQLQNAADAAALAGAQVVKDDQAGAIQRAHDFAFMNPADQLAVTLRTTAQPEPFTGDETPFDILLGRWIRYNRTFLPTLDAPNSVKAIARRNAALGASAPPLGLVFGPMAGVDTIDAVTVAVAHRFDSSGAALICLSDTAVPGLWIAGTADIDIDKGGIHVNSTAEGHNKGDAAWIQGNTWIDCGFINVVGEIDPPPLSSDWQEIGGIADGSFGGTVTDSSIDPGPEHVDDPVAANMVGSPYVSAAGTGIHDHLNLPQLLTDGLPPSIVTRTATADGTPITGTVTSSCRLLPGYYPYGLNVDNGSKVTLDPQGATSAPGTLFVFGGAGMAVKGELEGHGVTCYVTHIPSDLDPAVIGSDEMGATDWAAGAIVDLWSPGDWAIKDNARPLSEEDVATVSGLNGIPVWQDPTMVGKKGEPPLVKLNGHPSGGVHGTLYFPDPIPIELNGNLGQLGNQILCGSAKINGTAVLTVDYDGRNSPEASFRSCLVK